MNPGYRHGSCDEKVEEAREKALGEAFKIALVEWITSKRSWRERETAWHIADLIRGLMKDPPAKPMTDEDFSRLRGETK